MSGIVKKWRCSKCGATHADLWNAQNCCWPTLVYICPECAEEYSSLAEANECIEEHIQGRSDLILKQADFVFEENSLKAEELEALGQLRLIG